MSSGSGSDAPPAQRNLKLLTHKSHQSTGKNNIKPLITRINTDIKKWAREAFAARMGQGKNKNSASNLEAFLLSFCQSQLSGIIRANQGYPWLLSLQPRPARGRLKT